MAGKKTMNDEFITGQRDFCMRSWDVDGGGDGRAATPSLNASPSPTGFWSPPQPRHQPLQSRNQLLQQQLQLLQFHQVKDFSASRAPSVPRVTGTESCNADWSSNQLLVQRQSMNAVQKAYQIANTKSSQPQIHTLQQLVRGGGRTVPLVSPSTDSETWPGNNTQMMPDVSWQAAAHQFPETSSANHLPLDRFPAEHVRAHLPDLNSGPYVDTWRLQHEELIQNARATSQSQPNYQIAPMGVPKIPSAKNVARHKADNANGDIARQQATAVMPVITPAMAVSGRRSSAESSFSSSTAAAAAATRASETEISRFKQFHEEHLRRMMAIANGMSPINSPTPSLNPKRMPQPIGRHSAADDGILQNPPRSTRTCSAVDNANSKNSFSSGSGEVAEMQQQRQQLLDRLKGVIEAEILAFRRQNGIGIEPQDEAALQEIVEMQMQLHGGNDTREKLKQEVVGDTSAVTSEVNVQNAAAAEESASVVIGPPVERQSGAETSETQVERVVADEVAVEGDELLEEWVFA